MSAAHCARVPSTAHQTLLRSQSPEEQERVIHARDRDDDPENMLRISRKGVPGGLLVRSWDKVARLENLASRGAEPENESLRDSLLDLTNYAAIGIMVENEWFRLPLSEG